MRFVTQELPDQADRVGGFFRHKGAYARFKDLLESEGLLEKWYNFEAAASDRALRDWCAENDIQIIEQKMAIGLTTRSSRPLSVSCGAPQARWNSLRLWRAPTAGSRRLNAGVRWRATWQLTLTDPR